MVDPHFKMLFPKTLKNGFDAPVWLLSMMHHLAYSKNVNFRKFNWILNEFKAKTCFQYSIKINYKNCYSLLQSTLPQ